MLWGARTLLSEPVDDHPGVLLVGPQVRQAVLCGHAPGGSVRLLLKLVTPPGLRNAD